MTNLFLLLFVMIMMLLLCTSEKAQQLPLYLGLR